MYLPSTKQKETSQEINSYVLTVDDQSFLLHWFFKGAHLVRKEVTLP